MLTSRKFSLLKNKLDTGLKKLATATTHFPLPAGTPPRNDPRDEVAVEMFLWSELRRVASAGYEAAMAKAVNHGICYDKKTSDKDAGNYTLYEGDDVYVTSQVKRGGVRLDKAALRQALSKRGMSVKKIDEAFAEAEKRDANSHTFTAWLRVADEPVNSQPPASGEVPGK